MAVLVQAEGSARRHCFASFLSSDVWVMSAFTVAVGRLVLTGVTSRPRPPRGHSVRGVYVAVRGTTAVRRRHWRCSYSSPSRRPPRWRSFVVDTDRCHCHASVVDGVRLAPPSVVSAARLASLSLSPSASSPAAVGLLLAEHDDFAS